MLVCAKGQNQYMDQYLLMYNVFCNSPLVLMTKLSDPTSRALQYDRFIVLTTTEISNSDHVKASECYVPQSTMNNRSSRIYIGILLLTLYASVHAAKMQVLSNFPVNDSCLGCVMVSIHSEKYHFTIKECIHILNVNPCYCLDPR